MKTISIIVLLVALVAANEREWKKFKSLNKRKYRRTLEEKFRFGIFENNLADIDEHNKLFEQGKVTYKKGINQFADMTEQEFEAFLKLSGPRIEGNSLGAYMTPRGLQASSVNWTAVGAVTPVKNQGSCGSCWSFSATGAVEGQNYITTKKLVVLSEQNLIDCSGGYRNYGCSGGWMNSAFQYIKDNGITTEDNYPYEGKDGICRYASIKDVFKVIGYKRIPYQNENALISAIERVGPISVAIHVTSNFQFYTSGIFTDSSCDQDSLNHGVLATGYDEDSIYIKNSWGTSWGENGYIKFKRGSNLCGVATAASYPVL